MEAVVRHNVFDSRDVITSKCSSNSFVEDFDAKREKSPRNHFLSAKDSLVNMPPEDTNCLYI